MTTKLEELAALQARIEALPNQRAKLINDCRAEHHTWREIAETLGMTEHGAIKAAKPAQPRGRPKKS